MGRAGGRCLTNYLALLLSCSEGTWPEVLRRMVLTRGAEAEAEERPDLRPAKPATMAASMLAFDR